MLLYGPGLKTERRAGTDDAISKIALIIAKSLERSNWGERVSLERLNPETVLSFATNPHGQAVPARKAVLRSTFSEYVSPSEERVNELTATASLKENYGTAPGPCAAFLEALVTAYKPRTVFTFGTARGDIESLIARTHSEAEIVTCDISDEEIRASSLGAPDQNNIRYRSGIGIENDEDIGKNFKHDPKISGRIHQIICDSFALNPVELTGTMDLLFIDACHQLPNVLMDLASSLQMANRQTGAVIILDDFRKASPLNSGVEAAAIMFSQVTGLSIFTPCPPPKPETELSTEYELKADVGVIIIPADFDNHRLEKSVQMLRDMALQLKSCEL